MFVVSNTERMILHKGRLQLLQPFDALFTHHREGDMGAGVCVGHSVVVVQQVVAAIGRYGLQLVVHQEGIETARQAAGTEKAVLRIGQVVRLMGGSQATFVERTVMGYQWQVGQFRSDTFPCFFKIRGFVGIFGREAVYGSRPAGIIVGVRTDQAVNAVDHDVVFYDSDPDTANAAAFSVSGFKVYSGKSFHFISGLN